MRHPARFLCVGALLFVPLAGCGEETPLCEGVECEDDGNECTDAVCDPATGMCMHVTVEDNSPCDFDGLPGLCWAGECVDAALCDDVECEDDGNECTENECDPTTGECVLTTVEDGTECADGVCEKGVCRPACIEHLCHCSEVGIRAAIEKGGATPYRFDCDGPTTVPTKDEIDIDSDVILDGEGDLTVDGQETHRVFWVSSSTTAELRGIKVVRGASREDGGGIRNAGTLTLSKMTVSSNSAQGDGGGIWNQGTLTLVDSTVADNTAANSGGGIENNSGSLELRRCTVSGNTAEDGGGAAIESTGYGGYMPLQLVNTTVSGNHPAPGRGAIEIDSGAMIHFSTLQQLPAEDGRYLLAGSGWVEVRSTILNGTCVRPEIYSYGYNIESPGDTCGLSYDPYYEEDWPDVSKEQLALGPLEDNGGPTLTHLPAEGSAAIDRIEPWACVDLDQRSVPRPLGLLCDVGSVEAESPCEGCDDENDCTLDSCDPSDGTCSNEPVPDDRYMYCDLGNGGTGGTGGIGGAVPGVCVQGECIPNACWDNPCHDGDDCTSDNCTLPDGFCWYENVPDGWGCYLGNGGTGGAGGIGGYVPGACYQGDCIPDPCWDNPCYDGNDCTWDECSFPDGSCSYTNVPDGYSCMGGLGECLAGECELYALCGAERSIPPTATTSSGILLCEEILDIFIEVTLAATPASAVQQGPIDFDMQFEFTLPPETVNDLLMLGASPFQIESLGASVNATMGASSPMPVWVYESPVPCLGILEWDTPYSVVTPVTNATWTLDEGSILELTAEHFEEIVDEGYQYVVLATEDPPANCTWETPAPSVSFDAQP